MAHTSRSATEVRKHPRIFSLGNRVGIRGSDGLIHKGVVHSVDAGGWIYVDWERPARQKQVELPPYLRATHCFRLGDKDAA